MGKYDNLVYTFPQEEGHWFGMISPRAFLRGNREMKSSNLTIDFTVLTKPQPMDIPHFHPLDEYILFTGADLNHFFDFDQQIEFWTGDTPETMEMVPITQSSIICVPAGLYHAPTYFKNFDILLSGSALYPSGDFRAIHRRFNPEGFEEFTYTGEGVRPCEYNPKIKCTYCGKCFAEKMKLFDAGEDGQPSPALVEYLAPYYELAKKNQTHQFDKYIHAFVPEVHDDPRFLSPRAGFRGDDEIAGSNVCFVYDIIQQECTVGELHKHAAVEEYLLFTGSNISKVFDFDAEIEIQIGEDPDALETITITKPTVIQIPPETWHGPVKVKHLSGTINYMPIYKSGKYGKIVREQGADGKLIEVYKGGGLPD
jgi:hypothetical protein